MIKSIHAATKSEVLLKVNLDYKINSKQRRLLRQVTLSVLKAGGNSYDISIVFMIGQFNALMPIDGDSTHNKKITAFFSERYLSLFEMDFKAEGNWIPDLNKLYSKFHTFDESNEHQSEEDDEALELSDKNKTVFSIEKVNSAGVHVGEEKLDYKKDETEIFVPDEYLEAAYEELQTGRKHAATWARAFSKANGESNKSDAFYISIRSEHLYAEAARLAEEERLETTSEAQKEGARIADNERLEAALRAQKEATRIAGCDKKSNIFRLKIGILFTFVIGFIILYFITYIM